MIYGWRGADIAHIQNFPNVYSHSQTTTLGVNYRCAKRIIRHANFLIANNQMRVPKKDVRPRHDAPLGIMELGIAENLSEERELLKDALKRAHDQEGIAWGELAILTRYKELYLPIIETLEQAHIPFIPPEDFKLFSKWIKMRTPMIRSLPYAEEKG